MSDRFIPFKDGEIASCEKCVRNPCDGHQDCTASRRNGQDGYFINVKRTSTRKSRDRRLLEALLNDADICEAPISGKYLRFNTHNFDSKVTDSQMKQLIAIKEAMERKGVK